MTICVINIFGIKIAFVINALIKYRNTKYGGFAGAKLAEAVRFFRVERNK